jgi:hypothetical protein
MRAIQVTSGQRSRQREGSGIVELGESIAADKLLQLEPVIVRRRGARKSALRWKD